MLLQEEVEVDYRKKIFLANMASLGFVHSNGRLISGDVQSKCSYNDKNVIWDSDEGNLACSYRKIQFDD